MPSKHCSAALGLASPSELCQQLQAQLPFFPTISWVERTDSTNGDLMSLARSGNGQLIRPWLFGAHFQDRGRGRAGRTWVNSNGSHLMFSCAFDVFLPARQLATLSPLAGVAATEALRSFLPIQDVPKLSMKWPNDLQWHQAKLAGILTEVTRASTSPLSNDHHVVIIGIGINLNDARALSQSLNRNVADWAEIVAEVPTLKDITAAELTSRIAKAWYQALNEVTAHGFQDLVQRYKKVDGLKDQHLNILDNNQVVLAGIGSGINEQGQLVIRHGNQSHAISVGEVSVRPFDPDAAP